MTCKLTTALVDDLPELVWKMREIDVFEIRASGAASLTGAVEDSCRSSCSVYTLRDEDDELICVFGYGPVTMPDMPDNWGCPWLLGTDLVKPNIVAVTKAVRETMALEPFDGWLNFVSARNVDSISWLRDTMGFTIDEPVRYGPHGKPFHPFHKRAETCAHSSLPV